MVTSTSRRRFAGWPGDQLRHGGARSGVDTRAFGAAALLVYRSSRQILLHKPNERTTAIGKTSAPCYRPSSQALKSTGLARPSSVGRAAPHVRRETSALCQSPVHVSGNVVLSPRRFLVHTSLTQSGADLRWQALNADCDSRKVVQERESTYGSEGADRSDEPWHRAGTSKKDGECSTRDGIPASNPNTGTRQGGDARALGPDSSLPRPPI